MATTRPPRRLSKDARREQLVAAAMPVVAEQGFAEFSLEDVAATADVTRNLLYHYFPRGRPDVALAVVDRAGRELTEDWVVDGTLPLTDRLAANFARMASHAMTPSDAWRIHRRARAAQQPELDGIVARYTELVIASISQNHLGTADPPPLVRLALVGFIAFAEAALDEARLREVPPAEVMQMLAGTLVASIEAARGASAG
jgi:AcrR family transcriptional regulator